MAFLYQPNTSTYEEIKMHMYAMKELGCNLVRIHIAGVDPRVYNLADKNGNAALGRSAKPAQFQRTKSCRASCRTDAFYWH